MGAKSWRRLIRGWLYNEAEGTPWRQVPASWTGPRCGAIQQDFEMLEV